MWMAAEDFLQVDSGFIVPGITICGNRWFVDRFGQPSLGGPHPQ
jgi:hypothetical protein